MLVSLPSPTTGRFTPAQSFAILLWLEAVWVAFFAHVSWDLFVVGCLGTELFGWLLQSSSCYLSDKSRIRLGEKVVLGLL